MDFYVYIVSYLYFCGPTRKFGHLVSFSDYIKQETLLVPRNESANPSEESSTSKFLSSQKFLASRSSSFFLLEKYSGLSIPHRRQAVVFLCARHVKTPHMICGVFTWRAHEESNLDQRIWRPLFYH